MFDDSVPSHVKNVVPELTKRGFTGTFYVNPGAGHYAVNRQAWEVVEEPSCDELHCYCC